MIFYQVILKRSFHAKLYLPRLATYCVILSTLSQFRYRTVTLPTHNCTDNIYIYNGIKGKNDYKNKTKHNKTKNNKIKQNTQKI